MTDQVILVVYDIRDNRLRFKVSNFLKKTGYVRVQKSVFVSPYNPAVLSDTEAGLRRITRENEGYDIQIYVFSQASYENRIVISKGYYIEEEEEFLV
ncbi:CRISPR-associated endonuclease Cas2 [Infirmifilum sp.]|uniref:CRISPR-associated endonuclease Cas2 n=1 Tax=Infirmifilum sp. TaxID=2856575 RepID=UPI003D1186F7